MASTNDNLFTSFPKGPENLCLRYSIGAAGGLLRMKWLDGRLQLADLGALPQGGTRPNREQCERFFRWLSAFGAADAGAQWEFLAPEGSVFQREVWKTLLTIGWGTRTSYGALAAKIRRPGAARAVASAVAANPIALWIPCHRVIQADGQVGGFRWGRAMKAALLEMETGRRNWGAVFSQNSAT
jgi:O-6-methylguanine DNA methyltransferase